MQTVTEILLHYGITKETRHRYGQFYDKHFAEYKDSKKIFEIGVDTGISIQAWLDYFPSAHIYGMDIAFPDALKFTDTQNRVTLIKGDQGNINDLNKFIADYGEGFDIIIDDGGHTMQQQQLTLKTCFKLLRPGGMYVVEDLHTSHLPNYDYGQFNTKVTTLSLLLHLQHAIGDRSFSSEFISSTELNDLKDQIEYCVVEKDLSNVGDPMVNSEICFIKKIK